MQIKTWKEDKQQPFWEGHYQVLLTTAAAVQTTEKGGLIIFESRNQQLGLQNKVEKYTVEDPLII